MAKFAVTHNVQVAAASYTMPTNADKILHVDNIGANPVWLSLGSAVTAAADADECVYVPAASDRIIRYAGTVSAIAIGGTSKVVFSSGLNRG